MLTSELIFESDEEFSVGEDSSDDNGDKAKDLSLNYSREDVHALAVRAEKLVLQNTQVERVKKDAINISSDSDYESKHSRECFISSEPNIFKRRTSFSRRRLKSRRKEWRKSLPECLEFFTPVISDHQLSRSDSWDKDHVAQEQCFKGQVSDYQEQKYSLDFGEDYQEVLDDNDDRTDTSEEDMLLARQGSSERRRSFRNIKVQVKI